MSSELVPNSSEPPLQPGEERNWAMGAWLSMLLIGFLGPLLILLILAPRGAFLKDQATEALNFAITYAIAVAVSFLLCFVLIGFIVLPIVLILQIVFTIIGAVEASKGNRYRAPAIIRMVK